MEEGVRLDGWEEEMSRMTGPAYGCDPPMLSSTRLLPAAYPLLLHHCSYTIETPRHAPRGQRKRAQEREGADAPASAGPMTQQGKPELLPHHIAALPHIPLPSTFWNTHC